MPSAQILVVGNGHLASRVRERLVAAGTPIVGADTAADACAAAYLVDELDDVNLEALLRLHAAAPTLPVTIALFNESVAGHLASTHPDVRVVNPAAAAAPAFVEALTRPVTRRIAAAEPSPPPPKSAHRPDRLLAGLIATFALIVAISTAYFHVSAGLEWIDALYFVAATVATVGYGDINLQHAPTLDKLFDIGLIAASTILIWLIFSLTIDRIIRRRVELSLGRFRHDWDDHVIVCGHGRVGRQVVTALLDQGERVLIVEKSSDSWGLDRARARGAAVYVGDARAGQVLEEVGTRNAKAMFALTHDDFANVEIGLNARAMHPNLRVVLRIYDPEMAGRVRDQFDIHLALSMSAIAAERIVAGGRAN